jgi:antitoxin (DNA-binding transcriptional repressor) of toxin-antitoxin stability system
MTDPDLQPVPQLAASAEKQERNWMPLAIAAGVVILIAAVFIIVLERGKPVAKVTPISAAPDAYAASLPITRLVMSESSNLAGSKVTYVDGQIANQGTRTVTGVTVQVLFRDGAHQVAQNETLPMKLIRIREPYVDLEPVSAAPLKPGDEHDFRFIFDAVSPDWDGAYPELRVIHVDGK